MDRRHQQEEGLTAKTGIERASLMQAIHFWKIAAAQGPGDVGNEPFM
jgi:hypothetical protein